VIATHLLRCEKGLVVFLLLLLLVVRVMMVVMVIINGNARAGCCWHGPGRRVRHQSRRKGGVRMPTSLLFPLPVPLLLLVRDLRSGVDLVVNQARDRHGLFA